MSIYTLKIEHECKCMTNQISQKNHVTRLLTLQKWALSFSKHKFIFLCNKLTEYVTLSYFVVTNLKYDFLIKTKFTESDFCKPCAKHVEIIAVCPVQNSLVLAV